MPPGPGRRPPAIWGWWWSARADRFWWSINPSAQRIGRIEGLGDLSHASIVYSPDQRFAYVFGRDGGLTKVDILAQEIVDRVMQAGNSIGGAISDDGRYVAVSNYEPGGVRVFDAETLEMVADIPTGSKTVGLVDIPGTRFVFSLWDAGETWIADLSGDTPEIRKIAGMGANPYDALVTGDGRTYIAGLFGEDHLTALDLWQETPEPQPILPGYAKGREGLPVYKMPHLEGWALAGHDFALARDGPARGALGRCAQPQGKRANGGARTAGLCHRASRWAAGLGEFRASRQ